MERETEGQWILAIYKWNPHRTHRLLIKEVLCANFGAILVMLAQEKPESLDFYEIRSQQHTGELW